MADVEAPPAPQQFRISNVHPPPPLDVDVNAIDNWQMWKQMWCNYAVVSGLDNSGDNKLITAMLLHCIGKEALRI